MMDLLLDTHVAIWWMLGSDRLGAQCKATLFQPGARLWISTASVWEMAIKSGLGRLKLSTPLEECIPDLLARGVHCLAISLNHALAIRTLPPHHADPFDRMLIAQAQCESLTLVTADTLIRAYDIRTLDAAS
jgi:PIN domain nuclease of toxin-antitoxin system